MDVSDDVLLSDAAAAEPAIVEPAPVDGREALLDALFRTARTHYRWTDRPVTDDELRDVYALLRMGPTSANSSPARFLFLRSVSAKERLRPALSAGNVDKTMSAPVVCIVAHDPQFFEHLPRLYPQAEARSWFSGNERLAHETAFRNGTLQGAYLILAARACGLDAGPMSGFDNEKVDAEFMPGHGWKSNFLVSLGHGDAGEPHPRAPRLEFGEACVLL